MSSSAARRARIGEVPQAEGFGNGLGLRTYNRAFSGLSTLFPQPSTDKAALRLMGIPTRAGARTPPMLRKQRETLLRFRLLVINAAILPIE